MIKNRLHYAVSIPTLFIIWLTCAGHSFARHTKHPPAGPPRCPNCGPMVVPYPLSTAPNCGDQAYKIRCVAGKLYFDALHGSAYVITSINPMTQRIVLHPPGLATSTTCLSADVSKQGLELDPHLPFSITSSNTILLLSCPAAMLQAPIDCTPTSMCHGYIKDNAQACSKAPFCCTFKTDESQTAYTIRINGGGCLAYQSFVGLDPNKGVPPGRKWPEPGLELQWTLPKEPVCKTDMDCNVLLGKSKCLPDPTNLGLKRCSCKKGLFLRWEMPPWKALQEKEEETRYFCRRSRRRHSSYTSHYHWDSRTQTQPTKSQKRDPQEHSQRTRRNVKRKIHRKILKNLHRS